jgi:hypothetical protein
MKLKMLKISIAGLLFSITTLANAAMIKSYDFNGNLSDTLGNGLDLVSLGGSVSGGQYHFDEDEGLILNSAVSSITDFAFEIGFTSSDWQHAWNRLVNFNTGDEGLYYSNNGDGVGVSPYSSAAYASGSLATNTAYVLSFVKSSGFYTASINGSSVTFNDTNNYTTPSSNVLRFFQDDVDENFAGSVDFIRIHDDASSFGQNAVVPAPSTIAIFTLGIIGLASRRSKKSL